MCVWELCLLAHIYHMQQSWQQAAGCAVPLGVWGRERSQGHLARKTFLHEAKHICDVPWKLPPPSQPLKALQDGRLDPLSLFLVTHLFCFWSCWVFVALCGLAQLPQRSDGYFSRPSGISGQNTDSRVLRLQ